MHRLVVHPGTPQTWEIQLKPGSNFIGRGPANDFKIDDSSISTSHCEIIVDGDTVRLRDLGSTNGTFVDQMLVRDTLIKAGQSIRLGSVELLAKQTEPSRDPINLAQFARMEPPSAPAPLPTNSAATIASGKGIAPPTTAVALTLAPASLPSAPPVIATGLVGAAEAEPVFCRNHYQNAARFRCEKCQRYLCDLCVNTRGMAGGGLTTCKVCASPCSLVSMQSHVPKELNFFKSVPGAFKYPVVGDGLILLLGGAFFFGFLDGAYYIAINAGKYAARGIMMRAVFICFVLGTGYLFSYLKKIVYATAQGDRHPPDWPELSEWQADILAPMYQFLVISLLSFGPALALLLWFQGDYLWAVWLSLLAGCFYFPMGLLGVAMFDSLAALNPLFVVGSILRVPGEYIVAALVFTLILGFRVLVETVLNLVLPVPLVATLFADLLGIYLLIVQTRILGLLYFARKDTLSWFRKLGLPGSRRPTPQSPAPPPG